VVEESWLLAAGRVCLSGAYSAFGRVVKIGFAAHCGTVYASWSHLEHLTLSSLSLPAGTRDRHSTSVFVGLRPRLARIKAAGPVLYSQHGSAYGVVIMAQMEESDGMDPNECQASVGSAAATQVTMSCSSLRLGLGRGDHHERGSQFDRGSTPKIKWTRDSTDLAVFAPFFPAVSFVFRRSAAGKLDVLASRQSRRGNFSVRRAVPLTTSAMS
jgi:hypothetical protein